MGTHWEQGEKTTNPSPPSIKQKTGPFMSAF